jgi:hypothetical protein
MSEGNLGSLPHVPIRRKVEPMRARLISRTARARNGHARSHHPRRGLWAAQSLRRRALAADVRTARPHQPAN